MKIQSYTNMNDLTQAASAEDSTKWRLNNCSTTNAVDNISIMLEQDATDQKQQKNIKAIKNEEGPAVID